MKKALPRIPDVHRDTKPGFSLLEVLIALALACVVTAAVTAIYQSVSITTAALRRQRGLAENAGTALDIMRRDLACAIPLSPDMSAPLMLSSAPVEGVESSSVVLYTAIEKTAGEETSWSVDRVVYQVEQDPEKETGGKVLVRLSGEATVTDPVMSREELVIPVEQLTVSVSDGTNWYSKWPVEGSSALPSAALIVLEWKDAKGIRAASSIAAIRAGKVFEPATTGKSQTSRRGFSGGVNRGTPSK